MMEERTADLRKLIDERIAARKKAAGEEEPASSD
jgi:hypothetical protein